MSAFFLAINRDGTPFSQTIAQDMSSQLEHFGIDGQRLIIKDNFTMAYHRHWLVPEEKGEQQPLYDQATGLYLMFYGRIDNRAKLFECLGTNVSSKMSDAALFLQLYLTFGESKLAQIIGPFVFVIFNPEEKKVVAGRDAMGGRYLSYRITQTHIFLSSYEIAMVAHPQVDYRFNEEKLVRVLINKMDDVPTSLIAKITPVYPGQKLVIDSDHHQLSIFYLPDPMKRIHLSSNQAYADEFKRLLKQAVQRRLRSIKKVGCMLSGGMDSVPIAITAASLIKQQGQQLNAFSWVFDNYPEADERYYSEPICDNFSIKPHWVNCDTVWPKLDKDTHQNPLLPFSSPYSEFNQVLFEHAKIEDVGVLLSGIGGDMLYTGFESNLYELLAAQRWRDCFAEACRIFTNMKSKRGFLKRFIFAPLMQNSLEKRRLKKINRTDYLTETAQNGQKNRPSWLDQYKWQSRRPQQYENVLGSLEGEDAHYGKYMEVKYQLERRYPFRDRELAEYMLAIPSDQLFFNLTPRPIVRQAFVKEFPEILRHRKSKTSFNSIILAGIKKDKNYKEWLNGEHTNWQRFVKESEIKSDALEDDRLTWLEWRCGYYEFWKTLCYTPLQVKLGSQNLGLNHETD